MTTIMSKSKPTLPSSYAAISRRAPIPRTANISFPNTIYSVTTNAFHPPPQAVMLPVTKDGITAGRISFFHLLTPVNLCMFDVSIRSEGIAIIPPIRLNRRYHCMPVIVSIIDVNCIPPGKSIVARMIIGKIAGRKFRAGPAMSAVVSSAFVGSTTGSIGANIATTGSFTIPLMKRVGYSNEQAGAIEAAASSGGQIMPPVMGAAAFAMAGITGVPYLHIVLISIIPAIIYFCVLGLYAQFQATKANLPHIQDEVDIREMFLRAPLFIIPISIIIYFLVIGRTLMFSAFWGIISVLVISTIRKETRASLKTWMNGFAKGSGAAAQIALSAACIGMVVQTLILHPVCFQ